MIIIDMGTGLRELGNDLLKRGGPVKADIFLSHTHWDHIHGWPFFVPAFISGNSFTIHGPVSSIDEKLSDVVGKQMTYSYFPVKIEHMEAEVNFVELKEEKLELGEVKIRTQYLNHPILCLGYRFEVDDRVFVYASDNEPYYNVFESSEDDLFQMEAEAAIEEMNIRILNFIKGADLLVHDAQYTAEEYPAKIGWGHTSVERLLDNVIKADVKRVALFHHDPERTDLDLDDILEKSRQMLRDKGHESIEVIGASEGSIIEL
jgi:phosphoribosyl 1,2-cyclic phosphodiesterase